jgi:uncharacterized protein
MRHKEFVFKSKYHHCREAEEFSHMKPENNFRLEIKAVTEEGSFEGLLSVYDVVDKGGDLVERGAFTKTIQEHGDSIPMLWQHKADSPIGKLTLADSDEGLRVKGQLLMELPDAQKAYLLMKAGVVKGLSIGYSTVKKAMNGAVRHLKELRLYEGSVVTFPMNEAAIITSVKNEAKGDFTEELTAIQLHDAGYQMFSALRSALYSVSGYYSYDAGQLTDQEKVAAAETIIDQFRAAYLEYLPQFLELLSASGLKAHELEIKAGRTISAATRGQIQSAIATLAALLPGEAGGDDTTTSSEEAAATEKSEPVADHSAAESCIDEMRALLSSAA